MKDSVDSNELDRSEAVSIDWKDLVYAETVSTFGSQLCKLKNASDEVRAFAGQMIGSFDRTNSFSSEHGISVDGFAEKKEGGDKLFEISRYIQDLVKNRSEECVELPEGCVSSNVTRVGRGWFRSKNEDGEKSFFVRFDAGAVRVVAGETVVVSPNGRMDETEGAINPSADLVGRVVAGKFVEL